MDFIRHFWHKECVNRLSLNGFAEKYRKWCNREGYRFISSDVARIYKAALESTATFPKSDSTKIFIRQAADSLNAVYDTLHILRAEMLRLARLLPEFDVVMSMYGVGNITGSQLMAEIGDVRRFHSKSALVAFAGIDAPPFQSGNFEGSNCHISKRGSPHLRRTLFQISSTILKNLIRIVLYINLWTKNELRANTFMSIWWLEQLNFYEYIMPELQDIWTP